MSWGPMTHICVNKQTSIGSDNGLSPGRRQAIIWNNAGLLLIEPLGTNFSEISIGIQTFSFKKMHLNMSSTKWRPFSFGLNVLREIMLCHHVLSFYLCGWQDTSVYIVALNTLRPRQDGRYFAGDIFKCIFLNENVLISIKISLKFVPKDQINNIQALV